MAVVRENVLRGELARHLDVLERAFGMESAQIVETQGGWSARAFRVEAGDRSYFLKVYDTAQASVRPFIDRIDSYIHVQAWLADTEALRGLITAPVKALDGRYKVESGEEVYLLHDYIPGVTPGFRAMNQAQMMELAGILAKLHGFGPEVPVDTSGLPEDISLWFCEKLDAYLDEDDPSELGTFMRPYRELLKCANKETMALRDRVRAGTKALSLCHTDAHGSNVIQGERLVLVDWEGLCIAPVEADLFMYATDPHWDAFLEGYRAARPGFELNREMLQFYLLRRQVEDIWYYLMRLLYEQPDEAEIAEIYVHLKNIMEETERVRAMAGA